jgi:type I restriction enzyme S subunit
MIVMTEWKKYKLGNVIEFNPLEKISKNTICRKISMDKLNPYNRDIYECEYDFYSGGAKFMNGDTIMARITPCLENGKTAYVSCLDDGEVAFGSTEYIVLREKEGLSNSKFIYYLAISPEIRQIAIKSMVGSSGRQRVQLGVLENHNIFLPPIQEQKQIADILSSLDDKIALNKRINDNLEQQAQALYRSWFVDFEPFKDGGFVDSELGKIPEGWRVGTLKDLVIIKYGKDHKKLNDGKIPVYGSGGIMRYVDDFLYSGESVLIPRKGTLNNVFYVNENFWSVDTMFYTQMQQKHTAKYVYFFILSLNLASMNAGSAVPSMTTDILNSLKCIIAPLDIMNRFEILQAPIFKIMQEKREENQKLSQIRDSLLPKLMSGELKTGDLRR